MSKKNKNPIKIYDIAIIGAGINGCGIAREATGHGYSTFLCDKGDVGAATSASSSKLIHGGLRYLEQYDFKLVYKALKERKNLLNIAPHLSSGSTFILPYEPHLRSKILLRMGLMIYDFLSPKHLAKSKHIKLTKKAYKGILKPSFKEGFSYSDGRTDDHRLVILNALDAKQKGADIQLFNGCKNLSVENNLWKLELEDGQTIFAKTAVNATGPWASLFIQKSVKNIETREKLTLVKGSHITVPKIYEGEHCYIFQSTDNRIIFAIPYEKDFTLIGTTDVAHKGDPLSAKCTKAEKEYLVKLCNHYFEKQISEKDIVWDYAGVRPLIEDREEKTASTASRDYRLSIRHEGEEKTSPPLLNIWGGKLTTYRTLSQQALKKLMPYLTKGDISQQAPSPRPFNSAKNLLPGAIDPTQFSKNLIKTYPFLTRDLATRYATTYGTLCLIFLEGKTELQDLGEHFGSTLYAAEVDYLTQEEWAKTADQIIFYRTKIGLHLTPVQIKKLQTYLAQK